ncbi:MAG: DUF2059 domain-containing protein, partial [Pseudomonadota bacterium]
EPSAEELQALSNMFGDMFGTADALTAEQEARVPAAQSVVVKLFPEGTYAKMMDETMRPMLDTMLGEFGGTPAMALSQLTGLGPLDFAQVEDDKLKEALALFDPSAGERNAAMGNMMIGMISEVVEAIEPAYRAGLARAYAVRFTEAELADLDAYFKTPVGSKYAAESFLIFADPQVMSAMNDMMPAVMERMPQIMEGMTSISEDYPEGRKFSDLDDGEKAQLSELLGVTLEDLAISEPASEGEEWEDYDADAVQEDAS